MPPAFVLSQDQTLKLIWPAHFGFRIGNTKRAGLLLRRRPPSVSPFLSTMSKSKKITAGSRPLKSLLPNGDRPALYASTRALSNPFFFTKSRRPKYGRSAMDSAMPLMARIAPFCNWSDQNKPTSPPVKRPTQNSDRTKRFDRHRSVKLRYRAHPSTYFFCASPINEFGTKERSCQEAS